MISLEPRFSPLLRVYPLGDGHPGGFMLNFVSLVQKKSLKNTSTATTVRLLP